MSYCLGKVAGPGVRYERDVVFKAIEYTVGSSVVVAGRRCICE